MGSFKTKTSFNGEWLQFSGTSEGSVSISSKFSNGDITLTLNSTKPVNAVVTGNLDATVIGSNSADTFDFSGATGNYKINTRNGDDKVTDGLGNNTFDAGAGDGAGADTFVFNRVESASVETDTITNYTSTDRIQIVGAAPASVADDAGNVVITFNDGDKIIIDTLLDAAAVNGTIEFIV